MQAAAMHDPKVPQWAGPPESQAGWVNLQPQEPAQKPQKSNRRSWAGRCRTCFCAWPRVEHGYHHRLL